jgi:hypothetical protein
MKRLPPLLAVLALGMISCTSKQQTNNATLPQEVLAQLDTSSMQLQSVAQEATFVPKNRSVNATIDVNCGNHTYTISTGNNNGFCVIDFGSNHRVTGGRCLDTNQDNTRNNNATLSCALGCSDAAGSGFCSKKN